jgi:hypothetical protein
MDTMIGHNMPPSDAELLRERLAIANEALLNRHNELITASDRAPDAIDNEDTAKRFTDTIKMLTACKKSLEGRRVEEKEPYLTLERSVDGFFKPLTEQIDKAKFRMERVLGVWLKKKADEEKRRREEEAAAARAEAERLATEAAALEEAKMKQAADSAIAEASIAEQQATQADRSAQERAAKMASVHGDYGSRSSLRSYKVATILSRAELDLNALRTHFSEGALRVALNAWMNANWKNDNEPPALAGASFAIETKAQVR